MTLTSGWIPAAAQLITAAVLMAPAANNQRTSGMLRGCCGPRLPQLELAISAG